MASFYENDLPYDAGRYRISRIIGIRLTPCLPKFDDYGSVLVPEGPQDS
jgi:hypothetical protein